jgi:hypothetical protein
VREGYERKRRWEWEWEWEYAEKGGGYLGKADSFTLLRRRSFEAFGEFVVDGGFVSRGACQWLRPDAQGEGIFLGW